MWEAEGAGQGREEAGCLLARAGCRDLRLSAFLPRMRPLLANLSLAADQHKMTAYYCSWLFRKFKREVFFLYT